MIRFFDKLHLLRIEVVLTFLFIHFNSPTILAQEDQVGFKVGLNGSEITNSSPGKIKMGLNVGFYYRAHLAKNLFFRPEVNYSNQGQKDYSPNSISTTTTLQYLNLPFLLEYGRKFRFQIGPQVGVLVAARTKGSVAGSYINENQSSKFTSGELGLVLGLYTQVNKTLGVGVRFNRGISNISVISTSTYNSLVQFNFDFLLKSYLVKGSAK